MKTIAPQTLSWKFPGYWPASAADSFLKTCSSLSIKYQFASRMIGDVKIMPRITPVDLEINKSGNFVITINSALFDHEQAKSLGRAISHTFHYNLTKHPPQNVLQDHLVSVAESFSSAFSERWLEINDVATVAEWLRKKHLADFVGYEMDE